jgi:thiamine biosynthesis lipoprotein ApbE
MDPVTGAPRLTPVHSLTIAAPTCMHADVACGTVYGLARADVSPVLARLCASAKLLDLET